jgi:hypothetical protein
MATKGKDSHQLSQHPILAKLLAEGGPDVNAYRGYVALPGGRDTSPSIRAWQTSERVSRFGNPTSFTSRRSPRSSRRSGPS